MSNCNENAIREAAYYLWQNAGCPAGQDEKFWSMAVEQCRTAHKGCASCGSKKSVEATVAAPKKTCATRGRKSCK
jgi:hypothetical protein